MSQDKFYQNQKIVISSIINMNSIYKILFQMELSYTPYTLKMIIDIYPP